MLNLEKQNQLREEYRQLVPTWKPATEVYAALVRNHVAQSGQLLDLGCGRGGLIEQLTLTHGEGLLKRTVGLDPDWISIKEHRLGLAAATGYSFALPFVDDSFDIVFCSWLFEHLAHPQQDLAELGRVLRPGGVLIFITPNRKHPIAGLNRAIGRFSLLQGWLVEKLYGRKAEDTFQTWFRANDQNQLSALLKEAGHQLILEQLHTIQDPTYLAFNPAMFRFMCWFESAIPQSYRLHLVGLIRKRR
ncbi:MAG: class I SAM-dependent methyltransferase [Chloroflexota bacterium]